MPLVLFGRPPVPGAGHHLAVLADGRGDAADGVEDGFRLGIDQDHIAVAAHDFHHQTPDHLIPQLVPGADVHMDDPVHLQLLHPVEDAPLQVFSQEHAEHGRLLGIVGPLPGQVKAGVGRMGGQDQPMGFPLGTYMEEKFIFTGLVNFRHPAARQGVLQFVHHGAGDQSVEGHENHLLGEGGLPRRLSGKGLFLPVGEGSRPLVSTIHGTGRLVNPGEGRCGRIIRAAFP